MQSFQLSIKQKCRETISLGLVFFCFLFFVFCFFFGGGGGEGAEKIPFLFTKTNICFPFLDLKQLMENDSYKAISGNSNVRKW